MAFILHLIFRAYLCVRDLSSSLERVMIGNFIPTRDTFRWCDVSIILMRGK